MLTPSDLAPGLYIGQDVQLADELSLGAHVVIHPGVRIGRGCVVQDGAVIGKPPLRAPGTRSPGGGVVTTLGDGAVVGAAAVICAGASIGPSTLVGDHSLVRENATIGEACVLSNGVAIGYGVQVGDRVRIRNNTTLAPATVVEDDVFLGIGVSTTDLNTMGRGGDLAGVILRRACRVASGVTLLPGLEVGEDAVVGAASLVTRDVPAGATVMGVPARVRERTHT